MNPEIRNQIFSSIEESLEWRNQIFYRLLLLLHLFTPLDFFIGIFMTFLWPPIKVINLHKISI